MVVINLSFSLFLSRLLASFVLKTIDTVHIQYYLALKKKHQKPETDTKHIKHIFVNPSETFLAMILIQSQIRFEYDNQNLKKPDRNVKIKRSHFQDFKIC